MDVEKIYNEYFRLVYRYVLSLSGDPELSEDIAQDTFLKALRKADELCNDERVKAWLISVARNAYFRHYESTKRDHEVILQDERIRLFRLIHDLEEPYKEVFSLRIAGGLSFKEIGMIFGKNDTWARVTYHRAKRKLREALENEDKL